MGAGGARGPGGAPPYPSPPRAAGRERRFRGCRAGAPVRGWAARLGSGAWLSRTTRLPSGAVGRAGGRGREIRSHNIGLSPSPPQTFRRGWGSRGQFGGLGERILAADPTAQGTPAPRSPALLDQCAPRDAMAAGTACPAPEPPPASPRGAQEGSRTDCCLRR